MRFAARFASAVALVVAFPGAVSSETRAPYGGTVIGSLLGEPVSLDPVDAQSHAEVTVVSLIFDTLYRLDERGKIRPHLATDMPALSVDGRRARIALHTDVEFHNGTALKPADVVRSLRRAMRSTRAGWLMAGVRSIAVDGESVVIELRRKIPELATLLTAPATSITALGRAPSAGRAVGSGPFKLASFSRTKRRLVLRAAPRHFAGRPYVNTLELRWYTGTDEETRAYEAGRTHFSQRGAIAFAGHRPKYRSTSVKGPPTLLVYLGFGSAHSAITGSIAFRRALSLAISRNAFRMVTTGEFVKPANLPAPGKLGGSQALARTQLARVTLQRVAARVPQVRRAIAGKTPLEILVDRTRPDDRAIAEKVAAALVRLNMNPKITVVSATTLSSRARTGACDFYIGQLASTVPGTTLSTLAAFSAVGHRWGARRLQSSGLSARAARAAFQKRLPLVPLFHRGVKVHHRSNLRGIRFRATSRPSLADMFVFGRSRRSR